MSERFNSHEVSSGWFSYELHFYISTIVGLSIYSSAIPLDQVVLLPREFIDWLSSDRADRYGQELHLVCPGDHA